MNIRNIKRETWIVFAIGLILIIGLNSLMVFYDYHVWTNAKYAPWSTFVKRFEMSGFDDYPYVIISKWRPLYTLERHPLLCISFWPLTQLNSWLTETYHYNFAIYFIGALWTFIGTCSWMLMYKIMHVIMELPWKASLLITATFYGFSHVMMVLFVCDHQGISLALLLLTIYLAGKAIKEGRHMPLWQSLSLLFFSTSITTTNMVKIFIADIFTRKFTITSHLRHFSLYLLPLAFIFGMYMLQKDSTQKEEKAYINEMIRKTAEKDSTFAEKQKSREAKHDSIAKLRKMDSPLFEYTEHYVSRGASLVENIFGEGIILHPQGCKAPDDSTDSDKYYVLRDTNEKHRPVLLLYNHWYYYAVEAIIVALFIAGLWCGRRNKVMLIAFSMFLFDMLLHVGLEFASSDVYIMTAHWAFVIPISYACLYNSCKIKYLKTALILTLIALAVFLWWHNLSLIIHHIFYEPTKWVD